jgi:zinc/manganese transport system permease protein
VGFGWLSVVLGLAISYHADTAASATMAGTAVAQFFVVLTATEFRTAIGRRQLISTNPPRRPQD